ILNGCRRCRLARRDLRARAGDAGPAGARAAAARAAERALRVRLLRGARGAAVRDQVDAPGRLPVRAPARPALGVRPHPRLLEGEGLHVNEEHFLVEVVDPSSGEPVPDGETGELVFTPVTKEALPFLRYRTGDLASLTREPCPCGRTLARMSRVLGRTDDMLV